MLNKSKLIIGYYRCKQCNKILDAFEYLTSKDDNYICNKCVKKNHKQACGVK